MESDLCECRECEHLFNLFVVSYYDNICPRCKIGNEEN